MPERTPMLSLQPVDLDEAYDELAVPCPHCGAEAGMPCKGRLPDGASHGSRYDRFARLQARDERRSDRDGRRGS